MARNSAGIVVAGLTAAALAVVGVLAVQASSAKERDDQSRQPQPSVSTPAATDSGSGGGESAKKATTLPSSSGDGKRVVYALDADRVWLVEEGDKVTRTFKVTPGTVDPLPGTYTVTSRSGHVTGTDNVPVENVVRFADNDGVTIGFSAAINGKQPENSPDQKTGGIRESRKDGEAMWLFATLDTKVVVLP